MIQSEEAATSSVDKRGEKVREMFAGIAPKYDMLNHLLSLNIDRTWRSFTVRKLPPIVDSGAPILDVCTGTGDLAIAYAVAAPNIEVVGVDFCPPMLEIARRKAAAKHPNLRFETADAQALPFPNDYFQLATVAFGLRNVSNTSLGLSELIRVVKPGGRVGILEFSKPSTPVLGSLYRWYFQRVLPRVGQRVSPNDSLAYEYLPKSVMEFPDGEELLEMMKAAGLEQTKQHRLTLGIASLYVGTKSANATGSQ